LSGLAKKKKVEHRKKGERKGVREEKRGNAGKIQKSTETVREKEWHPKTLN